MMLSERLLDKLSDVINRYEEMAVDTCVPDEQASTIAHSPEKIDQARLKAQGEWFAAIAALETLLLSQIKATTEADPTHQGLILSAPTPILCHQTLTTQFQTGIFTLQASQHFSLNRFRLPAAGSSSLRDLPTPGIAEFPLFPQDPIATEQFCLLLTPHFGLMMVIGEDGVGLPTFQFSFDPEVVKQSWLTLRSRLSLIHHPQLSQLDTFVKQFTYPIPNYRLVTQFSRLLLQNLSQTASIVDRKLRSIHSLEDHHKQADPNRKKASEISLNFPSVSEESSLSEESPDVALLQALTHEIRTPLTTIRTMTRLLLRSKDLTSKMSKLLEIIDQECTEQINRMELIFRATELKTKSHPPHSVQLVSTSLEHLLQQSIPRWKKQAQRRNVVLDVGLPQKLPQVVSDPAMLDQILTGLIEKCTRSLATGGHIRMEVTTAGHQLKLQFRTESNSDYNPLKALGQLLMFQPETGSLSLNLDVTKNLFHRLGGKLIVRQRSQQGEVFTIFLPLGTTSVNKTHPTALC